MVAAIDSATVFPVCDDTSGGAGISPPSTVCFSVEVRIILALCWKLERMAKFDKEDVWRFYGISVSYLCTKQHLDQVILTHVLQLSLSLIAGRFVFDSNSDLALELIYSPPNY